MRADEPRPQVLGISPSNYFDHELMTAPPNLTSHLFHYTSANVAIFDILRGGRLRLSPFESTNDLWESRPLNSTLTTSTDDLGASAFDLWSEIDRNLRLHAKVACLTQDWTLPEESDYIDALRGWAHLPLWAHYGAAHTGVCLRFDRDKLVEALLGQGEPGSLMFHGSVGYLTSPMRAVPGSMHFDQVQEFGVDAASMVHAEKNKERIFFRKHSDWSNESEYRFVLIDQSLLPAYVDIRSALTGVVLGESFPQSRVLALMEALNPYPDIEVGKVYFQNRFLLCFPFDGAASQTASDGARPWGVPKQAGSLNERVTALRVAERTALQLRERAEEQCAEPLSAIQQGVTVLGSELRLWPNTEVAVCRHLRAVPAHHQPRSPGVPGEKVHLQRGFMCVVENLPKYSFTFVAAVAVQVLDGDQLRLHAVVNAERWDPAGNDKQELWRDERVVSLADCMAAVAALMADLRAAVRDARPAYDLARESALPGDPSTLSSAH